MESESGWGEWGRRGGRRGKEVESGRCEIGRELCAGWGDGRCGAE